MSICLGREKLQKDMRNLLVEMNMHIVILIVIMASQVYTSVKH